MRLAWLIPAIRARRGEAGGGGGARGDGKDVAYLLMKGILLERGDGKDVASWDRVCGQKGSAWA